jgi:putative transposase
MSGDRSGPEPEGIDVVATMGRKKHCGVVPQRIQVDRSEFISKALDKWAYDNQVTLDFSWPGKPSDNAFIESFNGSFRDECFNINWFLSLEAQSKKIRLFKEEYNGFRPHSAWAGLTLNEVVQQHSNGFGTPKFLGILRDTLSSLSLRLHPPTKSLLSKYLQTLRQL